jgi:hypothetical protein
LLRGGNMEFCLDNATVTKPFGAENESKNDYLANFHQSTEKRLMIIIIYYIPPDTDHLVKLLYMQ